MRREVYKCTWPNRTWRPRILTRTSFEASTNSCTDVLYNNHALTSTRFIQNGCALLCSIWEASIAMIAPMHLHGTYQHNRLSQHTKQSFDQPYAHHPSQTTPFSTNPASALSTNPSCPAHTIPLITTICLPPDVLPRRLESILHQSVGYQHQGF